MQTSIEEGSSDVVNRWLESQSKEIQLLLKNKSRQEIECLIELVSSFTECECKQILNKLSKSPDSLLKSHKLS